MFRRRPLASPAAQRSIPSVVHEGKMLGVVMAQGADPMQALQIRRTSPRWVPPLLCALLLDGIYRALGACPVSLEMETRCSGHGTCNAKNRCVCDPGFDGHDCGRKQCPKGPVWKYDKLEYHECSNKGLCMLGVCGCHPSYTGKACERLACAGNCFGRGRCVGLAQFYREMGAQCSFQHTVFESSPLTSNIGHHK